ncbi:MAG: ABC transporter permease, partial [Halobacteria archaeon]|nr:ABC transporter permease [Halobacteria archaeon]
MRVWIPGSILGAWALLAMSVYLLPLSPNLIQLEHILVPPGEGALLG